ncbi:hypothetical protein WJX81_002328 [Elliptochloris bilobata]|uniref:Uncharacterized protein n=1 Tax=Elliptochloris bilobata TaxID=381761 RepID=A0AAW1QX67_9CHLO
MGAVRRRGCLGGHYAAGAAGLWPACCCASFAAGDWSGAAGSADGAAMRAFTFYGQCRRALLTGHATCDFVFDTAAVRVLRALAAVAPASAGAPGELAFEACSLGLGNVSIASGSCFTYDLAKPVVVRLETAAAAETLPIISFWATYRDTAGTTPKHLVMADLRAHASHLF